MAVSRAEERAKELFREIEDDKEYFEDEIRTSKNYMRVNEYKLLKKQEKETIERYRRMVEEIPDFFNYISPPPPPQMASLSSFGTTSKRVYGTFPMAVDAELLERIRKVKEWLNLQPNSSTLINLSLE